MLKIAVTNLQTLFFQIQETPNCLIHPFSGTSTIKFGHLLPKDLAEFYNSCGGIHLYYTSIYGIEIMPPDRLILANPIIYAGITTEELMSTIPEDDISWSWYIIGESENGGEYITIDLAPERLGRCYESFWETHATPNHSPIIATSFTNLIERLLNAKGHHWYWLQSEFQSLGDAYNYNNLWCYRGIDKVLESKTSGVCQTPDV